jgi:uncharacterized protein YuzE
MREMSFTATYDPDADAAYIRLRSGTRQTTIEIDERHYVDVDDHGGVLGIEVLYPRMGLDLGQICDEFGLGNDQAEIVRALEAILPSGHTSVTAVTQVYVVPYAVISGTEAPVTPPANASRASSVPPEIVVS